MIAIDENLLAADLRAFVESFTKAVELESLAAATEMADRAQTSLRSLDEGAEHHALAQMWTYNVSPTDDGAQAEVFSAAEDVLFFNRTSARGLGRVTSSLYPVQGSRILAILEGGAKAHDIFPGTVKPDAKALTIPIPGSEERSVELLRKHGPGPLAAPTVGVGGDTKLRSSVHHPGVAPEGHIEMTAEFVLQWCDSIADETAQRIAARF